MFLKVTAINPLMPGGNKKILLRKTEEITTPLKQQLTTPRSSPPLKKINKKNKKKQSKKKKTSWSLSLFFTKQDYGPWQSVYMLTSPFKKYVILKMAFFYTQPLSAMSHFVILSPILFPLCFSLMSDKLLKQKKILCKYRCLSRSSYIKG